MPGDHAWRRKDGSLKKVPGKKRKYPDDRASGGGIILSKRAKKKLLTFGTHGERICWVLIKDPVCNLFIIVIYLSHRDRVQPSQGDITDPDPGCIVSDIDPDPGQ